MNKKKKLKNYSQNKRAFDFIISYYRESCYVSPMGDSIHSVGKIRGGGKSEGFTTRSEFICDIEAAISVVVPLPKIESFYLTYAAQPAECACKSATGHDVSIPCTSKTDEYIHHEKLADKRLGGARHSYEQRLGELFIRKGLYKGKK